MASTIRYSNSRQYYSERPNYYDTGYMHGQQNQFSTSPELYRQSYEHRTTKFGQPNTPTTPRRSQIGKLYFSSHLAKVQSQKNKFGIFAGDLPDSSDTTYESRRIHSIAQSYDSSSPSLFFTPSSLTQSAPPSETCDYWINYPDTSSWRCSFTPNEAE